MKTNSLLVSSLVLVALLVTACGGQASAAEPDANPVTSEPAAVTDRASLESALTSTGATVEQGDPLDQPFFAVPGQILKVNGADVQVFEYETAEAMEADAAQVSEDGGSIGMSMVSWMAPPHFYKTGRVLVLYVGDDQTVIELLQGVLGSQFAGR